MAKFQEIGEKYAAWLSTSVREDHPPTKKAAYISESVARGSNLAATLKRISSDLRRYTVDDKPLTEEQKKAILETTRTKLGLPSTVSVYMLVKAASIDKFTELADHWEQFFDKLDG